MIADPPASRRSLYAGEARLDLTVRPGVPRILAYAELARSVARTVAAAGAPTPAVVGLTLSDDRELAELNLRYLAKAGPTDVLSFPGLPATAFPEHPGRRAGAGDIFVGPRFVHPPGRRTELGDVIVSVERAVAQAAAGEGGQTSNVRWDPRDELRLLVIHGTLHLCGWDHAQPEEEAAMRALERHLLGRPVDRT